MAKGKYWHDGLQFSCQGCGHCCTFPGGFVYGSEKEFRRIADYLDLPFETFLERYTEEIDGRVSLVSPDNGPCVFYDGECTIYPVRPSQCSSYPFWQDILKSKRRWEREAETCRGMEKGKRWTRKEIEVEAASRAENLMAAKNRPQSEPREDVHG